MIKKLSILLLTVLCFLYCSCPILASNSNEFVSDYWINTNGYWIQPRKKGYNSKFLPINYIPLFGRTADSSSSQHNGCYFILDKGNYRVSGDVNGLSACYSWSDTVITLDISNYFFTQSVKYISSNKEKIINTLNGVGFKYVDNGSDTITYYSPDSYIIYSIISTSDYYMPDASRTTIYDYNESGVLFGTTPSNNTNIITIPEAFGAPTSNHTVQYGYRLYYSLSTDYLSIEPVFIPYIFSRFITTTRNAYITYLIRPNGDVIGSRQYRNGYLSYHGSSSAASLYPIYEYDTSQYNRSGRFGLSASFVVGIIPSSEKSKIYKLVEDLKNKKYEITDVEYLESFFTNSAIGGNSISFYNNGLDSFIDFTANKETHLPVSYANYVYNQHTYWNNRNNYYWWSILNYNPADGSGNTQEPDDSKPDKPSGGGGSGGGSGSGDGSGGDTTITIDTQNIENLLQQILELLQNQGNTDVDLTEIENLLTAIKNNLKDYTGDLTTINNTLTLINQFLTNNVDVPLSDLKTLLTDIKTLSEYQKEQLTGISGVLTEMKQLFINIFDRLGEIKDKIGGITNNIEPGTNLWDVLKALIDNLGEFLSSGLELFEKLLIPQGTFQTDFNSTITGIQDKLGVLYQPVDVFSNFLTNLYAPTETSTLADSGHVIKIPEAKYEGVTIIEAQSIDLDETVEKSGLKPLYDVYLLIVDMIVLFGILNLAFKKFHDIISENGGDYK